MLKQYLVKKGHVFIFSFHHHSNKNSGKSDAPTNIDIIRYTNSCHFTPKKFQ